MDYIVRKALDSDNHNIARTLVYSFEKDLASFTKDMEGIVKVFENGIETNRFFVAEQNDEMIGAIACADHTGRAFNVNKNDCTKHFGAIQGRIAYNIIVREFLSPLTYPATTGNIDVVGVLPKARGKGVAKVLLKTIIDNNPQYCEFTLEADSANTSALKCYIDFGFVEFSRAPIMKSSKRSRVFMKYSVQA